GARYVAEPVAAAAPVFPGGLAGGGGVVARGRILSPFDEQQRPAPLFRLNLLRRQKTHVDTRRHQPYSLADGLGRGVVDASDFALAPRRLGDGAGTLQDGVLDRRNTLIVWRSVAVARRVECSGHFLWCGRRTACADWHDAFRECVRAGW